MFYTLFEHSPLLERKNHWFLWSPLKIFHHLFFEICSWRFFLWRFVQEIFHFHEEMFVEICPFENLFRRFFLLWRCVHGDLSIEDLFKRFFLLKICLGDFFFPFWRFVQESFPFMKMCSWRFVHWKFIQEIFPFMKMCSWRFIHWRLECMIFIHFWRFVVWKFE